jgi:hypothetical protein
MPLTCRGGEMLLYPLFMRSSIMAAENIIENKNNNLWEINTDYENYQESSVITKTGLVKK